MRFPIIPATFPPDQARYLHDLTVAVGREMEQRASRTTGLDQLLLVSPSKKVFAVRVADDGTLTTTLVQE